MLKLLYVGSFNFGWGWRDCHVKFDAIIDNGSTSKICLKADVSGVDFLLHLYGHKSSEADLGNSDLALYVAGH